MQPGEAFGSLGSRQHFGDKADPASETIHQRRLTPSEPKPVTLVSLP
jgi:hypothetical protein